VEHLKRVGVNMIGLGELSPIDTARARLQEQVANFLAGRAKLIRMMGNANLSIKGQAQGLYNVQLALETRLQNEITPLVQKLNAGVWDASDIITIGGFTMSIIRQINDVGKLERQAGGNAPEFFDTSMIVAAGGLMLLGLGLMGGVFFGKRT
jgi:hypothetical protein